MNKTLVGDFRSEVGDIKRRFNYPKLGDAFVHLGVKLVFDLDDNDAFKFSFVGVGGREKGIDAFVPEEEGDKRLNIVQGKYSENNVKTCVRKDVEDLRSAYTWLTNTDVTGEGLKPELVRVITEYRRYRKQGYRDRLVLLFFGRSGRDADSQLALLRSEIKCDVDALYIDEIMGKYVDASEVYGGRGPDLKISPTKKATIVRMKGLPRSIIFQVTGEQIAELVSQYPFEIFQINVRHYLGRKNPVNKQIERTLDEGGQRRFFWYYNLGINAICDRFEVGKSQIRFSNLRIVNGAQTCNTLFRNLGKLENVSLMMRVIETKDLDLAAKIAISNNTQSPVKGRDLFSEDPEQVRLQKEFDKLTPPIFYERKRKEWDSIWVNKRREALRYVSGKTARVLNNETCGKAFMALKLRMPAEAKSQKAGIFVSEDFGGFYEKIFNPSTTPYQLLASHHLLSFVNGRISEFSRAYKEAEEHGFPELKKAEIERWEKLIEFLPHADTQLVALFGLLFESKYGEDYDFAKLCSVMFADRSIAQKLYEWLVDQLALHIDNVKSAFGSKPFNARNYLVNNQTFGKIADFVNTQVKYNRQVLDVMPT